MRGTHRIASVRAAEQAARAGLPRGTLVQRAATGLAVESARVLRSRGTGVYGARVLLLVGGGDNGADALWAGVQLARRGAAVTAWPIGSAPAGEALEALRAASGQVTEGRPTWRPDVVLDGLVGIGGTGALRPAAAAAAAGLEPDRTIAVDVPSGVDADTGAVAGEAVTAALTVTFGTLKPGLLVGAGRERAGEVRVVPIGVDFGAPEVIVLEDADLPGPPTGRGLDKYARGVVGVAAGSEVYTGAAVLSVGAAVRAGAGMVRFAGAPHAAEQVRAAWPEAVVTERTGAGVTGAGRVQAWVVGPGLGTGDDAAATVEAVLASDVPVLVDADALTVLAAHPDWVRRRSAPTVLTPHDREFARFGEDVGTDRLGAAQLLADDLGCVVLLKGDATVVAGPGRPPYVNATGTPHLATAGTGDVLSGLVGALLASGHDAAYAAACGAHLHGLAGRLSAGAGATSASSVLHALPAAIAAARTGRMEV